MESLVFVLAGVIAMLLLGALASVFGADSRDTIEDDRRVDPRTLAAGGAR
jgi:hypothetical protein